MCAMDTERALEAILFWKGEPVPRKTLAELLSVDEGELSRSAEQLRNNLEGRGVRILETEDTIALVTAPEVSELITRITKDELSHDIGKAGLETLSVILYRGPISKSEIDYIRGVNSQYILRSLLIRGLVERLPDGKSFVYRTTPELLAELGLTTREELPERERIVNDVSSFMNQEQETNKEHHG